MDSDRPTGAHDEASSGKRRYLQAAKASGHWDRVWQPSGGGRPRSRLWCSIKALRDSIVPYPSPVNYFIRAWLMRWLPLQDISVMEIGGAGGLGLLLSPQCQSYTLLDYSQAAITLARTVLHGYENVTFVAADMFDHDPPEPYGLVISIGLIEHFFGEDRQRCLQAHLRMSGRYVCVGAPADTPANWWRHFRFHATKEYPDQRPVSEGELFNLCTQCGLTPIAMTRVDPRYGRIHGRIRTALYSCYSAWRPSKRWAVDREDGGVVLMLAERCSQSTAAPTLGDCGHSSDGT